MPSRVEIVYPVPSQLFHPGWSPTLTLPLFFYPGSTETPPEFMVPFHVKDAVKMRQDAPNPDNSKESEMP